MANQKSKNKEIVPQLLFVGEIYFPEWQPQGW
jgi:hypothetical protein